MSDISRFLKVNKKTKSNTFYAATKNVTDENGNPLKWEIKPISTKENNSIQEQCIVEVPIPGKPHQYRQKNNFQKYIAKLLAASVVSPDLLSAELQDSYGVKTPEELVQEMIDDIGEWNAFIQFVSKFNGFTSLQEEINEAKN